MMSLNIDVFLHLFYKETFKAYLKVDAAAQQRLQNQFCPLANTFFLANCTFN